MKKMRLAPSDGVLDVLDDLLGSTDVATSTVDFDTEVKQYFAQQRIPRTNSPLVWWRNNAHLYPTVARIAKRFLGAPATSVPSERLFSSAGLIYSDRRNRLLPERAEMLLSIKYNLNFVQ